MADPINTTISDKPNLLVVGLGGAGCNIVARLAERFPDEIRTAAIDTDEQKLRDIKVDRAVLIGESVTGSNSAGSNESLGRRAALSDVALIREVISGSKFVIFVTGLGGGSGGGIAPVAIREARLFNAVTITFATLPFGFEGSEKLKIAEHSLKQLNSTDTSIVQLPNQVLLESAPEDIVLNAAFELCNESFAQSVLSMWRLMAKPGLINLDYGTIRDMLERCGGHCYCAGVEASVSEGTGALVNALIKHPLITRKRLGECHGMVLGITASPNLRFADVETVVNEIRVCLPSDVLLRWGVALADDMGDKISVVAICAETVASTDSEPTRAAQTKRKAAKQGKGQIELGFVSKNRSGYFQQAQPTLHAGEDLDEPTYLRRNIRLPR